MYKILELTLVLFLGILGTLAGIMVLLVVRPKPLDPAAIGSCFAFGVMLSSIYTKNVIGNCPLEYLHHMPSSSPKGRGRVMQANVVLRGCIKCFGCSKLAFTLNILGCLAGVMVVGAALADLLYAALFN